MYNLTNIIASMHDLVGIVGLSNNESSVSTSGRTLNEGHPLIEKQNLETLSPDAYPTPSTTYNPATTYTNGAKCNWCGMEFLSLANNNVGNSPMSSPTKWRNLGIVTSLDGYVYLKKVSAIKGVMGDLVLQKKLNGTAKTIFSNLYVIYGTGRLTNTVENQGRLVGFEITITRSKGIISNIRRIGLQMTATETINVYLFHSSSIDPITTYQISATANKYAWLDISDAVLRYEGGSSIGGSYYLVYYQADITGKAISIDSDLRGNCSSCNRSQQQAYNKYTQFMSVSPFYVPSARLVAEDMPSGQSFADSKKMWDITYNVYPSEGNFGMNINIDIGCDMTQLIIDHKAMFANAIIKKFAYDTIRGMLFNVNTRVNRQFEKHDRNQLIYELEGDDERRSGIKYELGNEIEALDFDTSGIDKTCLPCIRKSVRYGSI